MLLHPPDFHSTQQQQEKPPLPRSPSQFEATTQARRLQAEPVERHQHQVETAVLYAHVGVRLHDPEYGDGRLDRDCGQKAEGRPDHDCGQWDGVGDGRPEHVPHWDRPEVVGSPVGDHDDCDGDRWLADG